MVNENDTAIPCCPDLMKDDHCDMINFSRVLTYPAIALKRTANASAAAGANFDTSALLNLNQNFGVPLDKETRKTALEEVDDQLIAKNLLGQDGSVSKETKLSIYPSN